MHAIGKQIKSALLILILFTLLTGIIYPAVVTGIAQLFFHWRANGSLLTENSKLIGSKLIGQSFTDPKYFWGRPSATSPYPYNAENSGGSNMGPTNTVFLATIKKRVLDLQQADPQNLQAIPVDLVTASASGLDPEISPLAAFYQVPRIAKARNKSELQIQQLVQQLIEPRFLGIIGEPRVNVLQLNIALDNTIGNHI